MITDLKNLTIICIIGFLLCFGISQCSMRSEDASRHSDNLRIQADSTRYFKNALGTETATREVLQLDKKELKDLVIKKNAELAAMAKEFRQVKSVVQFDSDIEFKDISIKFDEPIVLSSSDSEGRFERSGDKAAEWYRLQYRVTNDSLQISKFETWTKTTVLTGIKQNGLFGKTYVTTDITNTNPFIKVNEIQSAELVVPSPWYKKWYIWLAAGVAGGLILK